MTRRDYLLMAAAFYAAMIKAPVADRPGVRLAAHAMADTLARANPSFDKHVFLHNAGVL